VELAGQDRVIVVGAGPTGLALAAEIALAGASCLVLERRTGLRSDSRAICLHARSMEMFDLRGQAGRFIADGFPIPSFPLGLKGSAIGFHRLDSDFRYILDMPQSRIEELLDSRAREQGAQIRWSSRVTGIEAGDQEVRLTLADGRVERAAYVVACDGLHSFVRDALGIPFPGAANPGSVVLADLYLDRLAMTDAYGELSDGGMLLVFPFRDGSCRLVLYDYARADTAVTEPVTLAEVTASLARISGQDLGPRDMYWAGRYRSESRQAPAYRSGRVFLAGDAAHTHSPAGAQGMNTGLQDALNLGWKLGAALAGRAPDWLLDSYHAERHPVGAAVLALTARQFRLNTAQTVPRRALRWAAGRLIVPLPPVQSRLARSYSGIGIRYPPGAGRADDPAAGQAHPLAGARLPPGELTLAGGSTVRLYQLFHDGRFVVLDRDGSAVTAGLPGQVRVVRYQRSRGVRLPRAVLVRPDGYIAWACDERDPAARQRATRTAIWQWCAPARPEAPLDRMGFPAGRPDGCA
jgi:2-polyprenyl-6-methoxyphenol hydroxylase-like FAD-dependent oxidoreductase